MSDEAHTIGEQRLWDEVFARTFIALTKHALWQTRQIKGERPEIDLGKLSMDAGRFADKSVIERRKRSQR